MNFNYMYQLQIKGVGCECLELVYPLISLT